MKKKLEKDPSYKGKLKICFVMDDCLADAALWKKDELVKNLLMNGRHF